MRKRVFGVFVFALLPCYAQDRNAQKPKSEIISGCVTPSTQDKGKLVVRSKDSCSELGGKQAVAGRLSGHIATLEGTLTEATSADPETFTILSVKEIGQTCTETCTLEPPGSRGLKRKMGKLGGTAGAKDTKPTEPPQR